MRLYMLVVGINGIAVANKPFLAPPLLERLDQGLFERGGEIDVQFTRPAQQIRVDAEVGGFLGGLGVEDGLHRRYRGSNNAHSLYAYSCANHAAFGISMARPVIVQCLSSAQTVKTGGRNLVIDNFPEEGYAQKEPPALRPKMSLEEVREPPWS